LQSTTPPADYPRITQLEQQMFSKTYVNEPVKQRLERLEQKAFGAVASTDDLEARTDALASYAQFFTNSGSTARPQPQPASNPLQDSAPIRSVQVVAPSQQRPTVIPGKSYALLIATNKYDPQFPQLSNPVDDARDIETLLKNYYGWETKLLVNPKRTEILKALEHYSNRSYSPEDQLFIYLAGHGQFDNASHDGVIVTTDSLPNDELKDTYIPRYSGVNIAATNSSCLPC
jgi:hypothetical protein